MLRWAGFFLLIAVVASIFGFGGIASASVGMAKGIFFLAIAGFLIGLVILARYFSSRGNRTGQK